MFLKPAQSSQENICTRVPFLTKLQAVYNFIDTKNLALVFSFEFCEIFKNTYSVEHLRTKQLSDPTSEPTIQTKHLIHWIKRKKLFLLEKLEKLEHRIILTYILLFLFEWTLKKFLEFVLTEN